MTIASLKFSPKATPTSDVLVANDVRTLTAKQLGVDVKRVTDDARFSDDLGADWLDRLELMIEIEERFPDVIITDEDVDQIEVVGDLIRHIETWNERRPIVEAPLQRYANALARAVEPAKQQETLLTGRHAHAAGVCRMGLTTFSCERLSSVMADRKRRGACTNDGAYSA